jgi:PAS domain-containing protein
LSRTFASRRIWDRAEPPRSCASPPTRDTATDPRWENCGQIAVRNRLRAIWSTPILADDNVVLGTFAMYYGEPRLPAEEHVLPIDMATQMARVAIEAKCDDEMLRIVFEGATTGMLIADLAGNVVRVNQAFAKMLGYTPAELRDKNIANITQGKDSDALMQELLSLSRQEIASDNPASISVFALLCAARPSVSSKALSTAQGSRASLSLSR